MQIDNTIKVKQIPPILSKLPVLSRNQGLTLFQTIYLHHTFYKDMQNGKASPESVGIILHEQTHVKRAKMLGTLKFGLLYLFSPSFRFFEELEANKVQWHYLKKCGVTPDLKRRAKVLSSWIYLWSMPYEYALIELKKTWSEC